MAGPTPVISLTAWWIQVTLVWLVLDLSTFHGVLGHLIRSPNQGNSTSTTLTALRPQQPNFDTFDIGVALYSPTSSYISLPSLPPYCAMYNGPGNECEGSISVFNVTYDDCTDAWTMCYCNSANMTLDDSVERLGKIPVGLRKYVGTTVVLPGEETHAYTLTNGDLHMFGDCKMDTWVHEAIHGYDYVSGEAISDSQGWLDAIASDSCATDNYGMNSPVEEFAQLSVLKIFSLIYGTLPAGWSNDCMANQLAFLDTFSLFQKTTLFANTCAAPSAQGNFANDPLAVPARPINTNGPPFTPDAPPRIDPNADPEVATPPVSVAHDPAEGDDPHEQSRLSNTSPMPAIYAARMHHLLWYSVSSVVLLTTIM